MFRKLRQSIPLLICLTLTAAGQSREEDQLTLQERARRLEPFITESAHRYGVDARILRILCFMESRYRLDAVSPKGARGPMQFMPETAARYGLKDPHDPKAAIDAAARYLRDLLKRFGGRVDLALAAYNAGEATVDSFQLGRTLVLRSGKVINPYGLVTGGLPPYHETLAYVKLGLTLFNRANTDRLKSCLFLLPAIRRRFIFTIVISLLTRSSPILMRTRITTHRSSRSSERGVTFCGHPCRRILRQVNVRPTHYS